MKSFTAEFAEDAEMEYKELVDKTDVVLAAITEESHGEQHRTLALQLSRFREPVASASSNYEVEIARSTLGRFWVDSGDWNSRFASEINSLLEAAGRTKQP